MGSGAAISIDAALRLRSQQPRSAPAGHPISFGERLDSVLRPPSTVLHDRWITVASGNGDRPRHLCGSIDQLVIAPSGVWAIVVSHDTGRLTSGRSQPSVPSEQAASGGERLFVGGCDRSGLVASAGAWAGEVRRSLDAAGLVDAPVHGVVCLVHAQWEWCAAPLHLGSVLVTWPSHLVDDIKQTHEWDDDAVVCVAALASAAFPERPAPQRG